MNAKKISTGTFWLIICVHATLVCGQQNRTITNSVGIQLAHIPAGTFTMGSPRREGERDNKEEQHEVQITKAFYLGIYEVKQSEYESVAKEHNIFRQSVFRGADNPVDNIEWVYAKEFCKALSNLPKEKQAGRKYRLPTEAEWEYACRAGTSTAFHFGESLSSEQANFNGKYPAGEGKAGPYLRKTAPVGSYPSNSFGLHDMHGNVAEWCADWYDPEYYFDSPDADPLGPPFGIVDTGFTNNGNENFFAVVRGGCWADDGRGCRSAYRFRAQPNTSYRLIGFRVVCDIESEWAVRSNRVVMAGLAAIVIAGCSADRQPVATSSPPENVNELAQVTLYVANMNKDLNILWGDWPNKVKEALVELEGVVSVEDEWERQIESDEDLDLLFVSYKPNEVTIKELQATISEQGYTAELTEEK